MRIGLFDYNAHICLQSDNWVSVMTISSNSSKKHKCRDASFVFPPERPLAACEYVALHLVFSSKYLDIKKRKYFFEKGHFKVRSSAVVFKVCILTAVFQEYCTGQSDTCPRLNGVYNLVIINFYFFLFFGQLKPYTIFTQPLYSKGYVFVH